MISDEMTVSRNSTTSDSLLLFFALLIGIAVCATVVGLLPALILLVGLGVSLATGKQNGITQSTRIVQFLGIVVALGCAGLAVTRHAQLVELNANAPIDPNTDPRYTEEGPIDFGNLNTDLTAEKHATTDAFYDHQSEQSEGEATRNSMITASLLCLLLVFLLSYIWMRPLCRQLQNIRSIRGPSNMSESKLAKIMSRKPVSSYSVADELKKWGELKEQGIISTAEFEDAKQRLLEK